jgi:hypothetical protein
MWREKLENFGSDLWLILVPGALLWLDTNMWIPLPPEIWAPFCLLSGGALGYYGLWSLNRYWRIRNTPVREETHPVLGKVTIYPKHWQSQTAGAGWHFWGDLDAGGQPEPAEISLAQEVLLRLPELEEESRTSLVMWVREIGLLEIEKAELVLESISLMEERCFSLYYSVPRLKKRLSEGLFVDFADFVVDDYGAPH